MFREIDAEVCIIMDTDDTCPTETANDMVNLVIERHADMAISDRLSVI